MSVSITALLAAALYEVRSELIDPASVDATLDLLVGASGRSALRVEVFDGELRVNEARMSLDAPGAAMVHQALTNHYTGRLALPAGITADQWRVIVELYGSAPGLYASLDDLRDAIRVTVRDAVVWETRSGASEGDLRGALFELPGLRATSESMEPWRTAVRTPKLTELTAQLDPLLHAATQARDHQDLHALADVLLQIRELEESSSDDRRAIVARERRRVAPPDVLSAMARLIPRSGTSPVISRLLGSLGHEGATALIEALSGAPGPQERRAYLDAVLHCRDCDDLLLTALKSDRFQLARDAAEICGRKGLDRAVPMLTQLLKHQQVEVRTAAWHALERIGNREARKALHI